jgi:hypothetical protein
MKYEQVDSFLKFVNKVWASSLYEFTSWGQEEAPDGTTCSTQKLFILISQFKNFSFLIGRTQSLICLSVHRKLAALKSHSNILDRQLIRIKDLGSW